MELSSGNDYTQGWRAIAAGNSVVCKPAPETPLCALALAKLFERAGGPPGVLNVIPCSTENTAAVGEELCSNTLVKHLSFTGSTAVGKSLNVACARSMKRISMELGGNAPFIVFDDADLEEAAKGKCCHHQPSFQVLHDAHSLQGS